MFSKLKAAATGLAGDAKEKALQGTVLLTKVAEGTKDQFSGAVDDMKDEMKNKERCKAIQVCALEMKETGTCPCCGRREENES